MPRSATTESMALGGEVKNYSCLPCRQRKVKCDRRTPCSNCARTDSPCSFVAPVRGKRPRTKPPKEGLHAKLQRYEKLLKSYGANVDSPEDLDSDGDTVSLPDTELNGGTESQNRSRATTVRREESGPKLIIEEGMSRYFDSAPWTNIGDGLQHPEASGPCDPMNESNDDESGLIFGSERNIRSENLASLHPPSQLLSQMKAIYVDRVDPFMKVLHIPTFWTALTNSLQDPQNIPKSLQAMMFAFYFATVGALDEGECQNLFGAPKSVLSSRYRRATRQALANANFLSTSSPMTLQAYSIFLMCARVSYRCDTLFVLSGVAIRLARIMGLHRDGTSLGLSPFETEMRRRLWWHLVQVDYRITDVLGTRPSLDLSLGDTKVPLNVNDEDLYPDMVDPPPERKGITTISPCVLRCELIQVLRKFSTTSPPDVRFEALYNPDMTISRKDSIIDQIEDHWESKYLRYCDPSNPLHTLVSMTTRSKLCKMRLFAHTPRQFANNSVQLSQNERDIVFTNATKLLEYATLMQEGQFGLNKYKWQIGASHLWNTMLYVLIEMKHRKMGPEVDKAWNLVGSVLSNYPQRLNEGSFKAVYTALSKWTLEVWDEYLAALKAEGLPEPSTPEYIDAIVHYRASTTGPMFNLKKVETDKDSTITNSIDHNYDLFQGNLAGFELSEMYDFPTLPSFQTDTNGWVQWEQLISGQGNFAQLGNM